MNTHRRYQYILTPEGPRQGITRTVAEIRQEGNKLIGVTTINGHRVVVKSATGAAWEKYVEEEVSTSEQSLQNGADGVVLVGMGLAASVAGQRASALGARRSDGRSE